MPCFRGGASIRQRNLIGDINPPPSPGVATSVTGITRVLGTASGGTLVRISGTGFQNLTEADVKFGGSNVTSISSYSPTTVDCVVPSHAAGIVDVVVGGVGGGNQLFEYGPAKSVTYGFQDFEGGVLTPFASATGATISTLQAYSGTHSVRHTYSASGASQGLNYDFGFVNPPSTLANGLWTRQFIYVPAATRTSLSSGQIKLILGRIYNGGGAPIGGWLEIGLGPELTAGAQNTLTAVGDQVAGNPVLGAHWIYPVDSWLEIVLNYKRNIAASTGTVRLWMGDSGNLVYWGSMTHANLGTNGTTDNAIFSSGVYSQNGATYPIDVFTDLFSLTDGVDF